MAEQYDPLAPLGSQPVPAGSRGGYDPLAGVPDSYDPLAQAGPPPVLDEAVEAQAQTDGAEKRVAAQNADTMEAFVRKVQQAQSFDRGPFGTSGAPWGSIWDAWDHIRKEYPDVPAGAEPKGEAASELEDQAARTARRFLGSFGIGYESAVDSGLFAHVKDLTRLQILFNREKPSPQEHANALPEAMEAWWKARHVALARQGFQKEATAMLEHPPWVKKSMVSLMYGHVTKIEDIPETIRPYFADLFPEQMAALLNPEGVVGGELFVPDDNLEREKENFREFLGRSVFLNRLGAAGLKPSTLQYLNIIPSDEAEIQLPDGGILTLADYSPVLQNLAEAVAPHTKGGVVDRLQSAQIQYKQGVAAEQALADHIADDKMVKWGDVPVERLARQSALNFFTIMGAPFVAVAQGLKGADEALNAGAFEAFGEGIDMYKGGVAHWLSQVGISDAAADYWKDSFRKKQLALAGGFDIGTAKEEQHEYLKTENTLGPLLKKVLDDDMAAVEMLPNWLGPLKHSLVAVTAVLDEVVQGMLAQTNGDENTALLIAGAGAGWFRRAAMKGTLAQKAPKLAGLGESWRTLELKAYEMVNPKGLRAIRRLQKTIDGMDAPPEVKAQMLRDISAEVVNRLDKRVAAEVGEGRAISPEILDTMKARPVYRAAAALEEVAKQIDSHGRTPWAPMSKARFAAGTLMRQAPVEFLRGIDASGFLALEMTRGLRGRVPNLASAKAAAANAIRRVLGGEPIPGGEGTRPKVFDYADAIGQRLGEAAQARQTYRTFIRVKNRELRLWGEDLKAQRAGAQQKLGFLEHRRQRLLVVDGQAPGLIDTLIRQTETQLRNIDGELGTIRSHRARLGAELERLHGTDMLRNGFKLADDVADLVLEPEFVDQLRRVDSRVSRAVYRAGREATPAGRAQTFRKLLAFDGPDDVLRSVLDEAVERADTLTRAALDTNNLPIGGAGLGMVQRIREVTSRIKHGMRRSYGEQAVVEGIAKRFTKLAKRAPKDPAVAKQLALAERILKEPGFDPVRLRRKANALAKLPEFADLADDLADQAKEMAIRLIEVTDEHVQNAVAAGIFSPEHARLLRATWHPHIFEGMERVAGGKSAAAGGQIAFGMDSEVFKAQRWFEKARVIYKRGDRIINRAFATTAEAKAWAQRALGESGLKKAHILEPLDVADVQNFDMVTDSLVARLERMKTLVNETAVARTLNAMADMTDLVMTPERAEIALGGKAAWTATRNRVTNWVHMADVPAKWGALAGKVVHRNVINGLNAWGKFNGFLNGVRSLVEETSIGSNALTAVTRGPLRRGIELVTGSSPINAAVGLAKEMRSWSLTSWILTNPKVWASNVVFNVWSMAQSGLHPGVLVSPTFWKGVLGLRKLADDPDLLKVAKHGVDFEVGAVSGEVVGEMAARSDWVGRLRTTIQGETAVRLNKRLDWLRRNMDSPDSKLRSQFELEALDIEAQLAREVGRNVVSRTVKLLYGEAKHWQKRGFKAYSMIDAGMKAGAAKYMLARGVPHAEVAWRLRTFWQNYAEINPMVRSASSGPLGLFLGSSVTSFPAEWLRIAANSARYRPLLTGALAVGNAVNNVASLHRNGMTVREWGLMQGYEDDWETAMGLASNAIVGVDGDDVATWDLGNMSGLNMLSKPAGVPRVVVEQIANQFPAPGAFLVRALGGLAGRFVGNTVPLSLAVAGTMNIDTFTGQHIYDPGAAGSERALALLQHAIKQFAPAIGPTGYTYETAMRQLDYRTGMIRPADERILHAGLDVKITHPEHGVATLITIARQMKPNATISLKGALYGEQREINEGLEMVARGFGTEQIEEAAGKPARVKIDGEWNEIPTSDRARRRTLANLTRYGLIKNFAELEIYGKINVLRKMRQSGLAARVPQLYDKLQRVTMWGPLSVEANPDLKALEMTLGVELLKEPTNRIGSILEPDALKMALAQFPPMGEAPELELMRQMITVQHTIAELRATAEISLGEAIRQGMEAARRAK